MKLAPADPQSGHDQSPRTDVELAASGDRRAFERLYREHLGRVFSLAVRMTGDRQRAEEITQDVFVRAWERLGQFRGESQFSTWLHKLAVNVILNAIISEKRDRKRFQEEALENDIIVRKPKMIGEQIDLEAAVGALPRGARTVFVLHDVEGFRHDEIATLLGITAGGSKAQLHRARMLLRESLNR